MTESVSEGHDWRLDHLDNTHLKVWVFFFKWMDAVVKVEPIAAVAGYTTCTLTGE